jgi:hypothetical protein
MDNKIYIYRSCDDISPTDLQKMSFIFNALQNGWEIKMKNNKYHFTKKHENKQEIYLDSYLTHFLKTNMDVLL